MSEIILTDIILDGSPVDIRISGSVFKEIVPAGKGFREPVPQGCETLDCKGKTAVPGFYNMHTHAAMSLMRGVQEDALNLQEWLDKVWAIEAEIDSDFVYWGTKVACLEMIRTGTTTFNDQYWFSEAAHKAAVEMGVRPVISYVVLDHNDPKEAARQREQCEKRYRDSLRWKGDAIFEVAFHAIYSVSEEMIKWVSEFARSHSLHLHIHLSETLKEVEECKAQHGGLSPVEYLDTLGVLSPNLIAAHTLWLSDADVRLLGERGVTCVHNINSNAKLASGFKFRYNELRYAGANVCLGTDGCASSNNLDMLEAMKTSAIFQKAWRQDTRALPLDELLSLVTVNGAKALGLDGGTIAEGKLADISIVDTDNSFFLSPAPFLSNLVYSAHSDCIESVIAGGRLVMKDRRIEGEREILDNAREVLKEIIKK